jgi:hypothetical protein
MFVTIHNRRIDLVDRVHNLFDRFVRTFVNCISIGRFCRSFNGVPFGNVFTHLKEKLRFCWSRIWDLRVSDHYNAKKRFRMNRKNDGCRLVVTVRSNMRHAYRCHCFMMTNRSTLVHQLVRQFNVRILSPIC